MTGTQVLDQIQIELRGTNTVTVYIDVYDNSLSRKWLTALNHLVKNNFHLEKNYCFFGFPNGPRNGEYLINQINSSIQAINTSNIGYVIDNVFTQDNCINPDMSINHSQFNHLHRYFEDLQGTSGNMSVYYNRASASTRWHIRQLNLLCHEFESWILSKKKQTEAPDWQRPSQLMCWLNSPRFVLDTEDYDLFGIESINRPTGGVFVGVNKAVGKHHWEVFVDEAKFDPTHRTDKLTTTTLSSQTQAAGDFDIEWAQNPAGAPWQTKNLTNFRAWLINNGFDPEDKSLTIGHPQVGQVDIDRSFGVSDHRDIWNMLTNHLDVYKITTGDAQATYTYNWSDSDYAQQQIKIIEGN